MDSAAYVHCVMASQIFQAMLALSYGHPAMLGQYSLPTSHSQSTHSQAGSMPTEQQNFTHRNSSQLVSAMGRISPVAINSGQSKVSTEEMPSTLVSETRNETVGRKNSSSQSFSGGSCEERGTLKSRETVAHSEAVKEMKTQTPAILERGLAHRGVTEDQDGLPNCSVASTSSKEYQELMLISELREKAQKLKKSLLRRFSLRKKRASNRSQTNTRGKPLLEGNTKRQHRCTHPNCLFASPRKAHLDVHISTHYPDPYFCPICHTTFSREYALQRHLSGSAGSSKKRDFRIEPCVESEDALRYEVGRDTERFNFYYLGVMEDYEMDDEHFEALAKRKRRTGTEDQ